jgi:hypothetical protein
MGAGNRASDQQVQEILDKTSEEYRQYIEIQDVCELTESSIVADYSSRDVNYPLGIVWQGRGDGILERTPC